MNDQIKNKLYQAHDEKKKIRWKNKHGVWSDVALIEAGLGTTVPQIGVRIGNTPVT